MSVRLALQYIQKQNMEYPFHFFHIWLFTSRSLLDSKSGFHGGHADARTLFCKLFVRNHPSLT